jgi:hypothetical protein
MSVNQKGIWMSVWTLMMLRHVVFVSCFVLLAYPFFALPIFVVICFAGLSSCLIFVYQVYGLHRSRQLPAVDWLKRFYRGYGQKYALTIMVFWVMLTHVSSNYARCIYFITFMILHLFGASYSGWNIENKRYVTRN